MAREHRLPPSAASLSASMRDIGYSLPAAIADLIDNSISADAAEIDILYSSERSGPALAIIDNGEGMAPERLLAAMRHGAANPRQSRAPNDLGRFGLGLKTASFSQCRRLTVVSASMGIRSAVEWNLDVVDERDDWVVSIPDPDEIDQLPFIAHLGAAGTVVIWRSLDRLLEEAIDSRRDVIVNQKLAGVERHLSLVFHRFLAGEVKGRKKLAIRINKHPIAPFDPFCRKNPATQILPEEIVRYNEALVTMQPYILPHHSRLTASEFEFYQDRSDFISNQGAYVYRNARLMAWGDWFRLVPKGEATKLARVQIDFPNSLDEDWTIDIKKSRARPPYLVRERLRQVIAKITARSVRVHRGRGQRLFEDSATPVWERYADHDGICYALNAQHPLVASLRGRLLKPDADALGVLLDAVAASLPVEMIYSDYSTHPRDVSQTASDKGRALDQLRSLWHLLYGDGPGDPKAFLQIVLSTRLFEGQIEAAEAFVRERSK